MGRKKVWTEEKVHQIIDEYIEWSQFTDNYPSLANFTKYINKKWKADWEKKYARRRSKIVIKPDYLPPTFFKHYIPKYESTRKRWEELTQGVAYIPELKVSYGIEKKVNPLLIKLDLVSNHGWSDKKDVNIDIKNPVVIKYIGLNDKEKEEEGEDEG